VTLSAKHWILIQCLKTFQYHSKALHAHRAAVVALDAEMGHDLGQVSLAGAAEREVVVPAQVQLLRAMGTNMGPFLLAAE
tara:strand:- start:1312 stop:1551 length:240 start_codon:yes stop_codon:yes gene_type:complete